MRLKTVSHVKIWIGFCALILSASSYSLDYKQYPKLVELVNVMTGEDGYTEQELTDIFSNSEVDQGIIDAMNKQYESLPWYKYRNLFINNERIKKGIEFWSENQATLERANQKFGVPIEVMVALIGIETHYGTRLGSKSVLSSLVTLTADFPRRSEFFGKELRVFLNTTRKERIEPSTVLGSFAGAIGIPQFMPSSYEAYSIDFNGNGQRDLVNEVEDAIGSVANYLHVHGWSRDQPIFAKVEGGLSESAVNLVSQSVRLKHSVSQLKQAGVEFNANDNNAKVSLLALKQETKNEYFVGFANFYALTRYNPSINYAMAVTDLSINIKQSRGAN